MLAWGANENGQLGLGDNLGRISPRQVLCSSEISQVACGSRTTIAVLASSKSVVGFGHAGTQVLGPDLDEDCVMVPRTIDQLERIAQVATRGAHALAVNADGELFAWGRGEEQDQQQVTRVRRIVLPGVFVSKIAVGRMHSVCLDSNGGVYTWGSSAEGQCGKPAGGYVPAPTLLHALRAKDIACGSRHTLLLAVRGNKVWGFGGNAYAQLGLGDREPRFSPTEIASRDCFAELGEETRLACGYRHSFVYTKTSAWAFGWNSHNQTSSLSSAVIAKPALLDLPPLQGGGGGDWEICQISGGGRHTLVLLSSTATTTTTTTTAAATTTLTRRAAVASYQVWAFGRGESGELGVAACPSVVSTPQLVMELRSPADSAVATTAASPQLPASAAAVSVACGWEHSIVTTPAGTVRHGARGRAQSAAQQLTSTSPLSTAAAAAVKSVLQCRGEFDAALAQFANSLVLLKLVPGETQAACGMTIALGNVLFGLWAQRTNARTHHHHSVTALPHGLNSVAFFAMYSECYLVVMERTKGDVTVALQSCLFCTIVLGAVQLAGAAWLPALLKRYVPQSALSASVAGIVLSFITLRFVAEEFASAKSGLASLVVVLIGFAGRERMPFGLPVALVSLFVGWAVATMSSSTATTPEAAATASLTSSHFPSLSLVDAFTDVENYPLLVSLVLPLALVNIVSNLACVDQARNGGDLFSGTVALQLDAIATLLGAFLFHCPFPTCVYVGHASFKAMGAGVLFPLVNAALVWCLVWRIPEAFPVVMDAIPPSATAGMLVWTALVLTSDAFKHKRYHLAVVVGLLPAMAAAMASPAPAALLGLRTLGDGYVMVALVLASVVSHIIDRRFLEAAVWFVAAALMSIWGWIHGDNRAELSEAYLICAGLCAGWAVVQWNKGESEGDFDK